MSTQWWRCVGYKYAVEYCAAIAQHLSDARDQQQVALAARMQHPIPQYFSSKFVALVPDSADTFKRWLEEMNTLEKKAYGELYPTRRVTRSPGQSDWRLGLELWAGVKDPKDLPEANEVPEHVRLALRREGLTFQDGFIPEMGVAMHVGRVEEWLTAKRSEHRVRSGLQHGLLLEWWSTMPYKPCLWRLRPIHKFWVCWRTRWHGPWLVALWVRRCRRCSTPRCLLEC